MDTETNPRQRRGGANTISIFVSSLCAGIVVAGGFGIILEAFVIAGSDLFELGQTFVRVMSVLVGLFSLWLFVWSFARSVHVERRLAAGLDVDEPSLSILGNLRELGPVPRGLESGGLEARSTPLDR